MRIRKFRTADAEAVSILIRDNFKKLELGGHTEEGIRIQIEANRVDNLIERSKKIHYFVMIDREKVIGICGYDQCKIHTLFVDVNHQKKGIGRKLLAKVLNEAKKEGVNSIKTWSTIFAEQFYKKCGFSKMNEILLPEEKKEIMLIEMKKKL